MRPPHLLGLTPASQAISFLTGSDYKRERNPWEFVRSASGVQVAQVPQVLQQSH